jgi:hypothetical protein
VYGIKDFSVRIQFADDEIMEFEYENFTLEAAMDMLFKDAKKASDGVLIESIRVTEVGI